MNIAVLVASVVQSLTPSAWATGPDEALTLIPQIEAAVKRIDGFLLKAAESRNAAVIDSSLTQVIRNFPVADFLWLEDRFRIHKVPVYLIAEPKDRLPPTLCARALWPFLPSPEFTLGSKSVVAKRC